MNDEYRLQQIRRAHASAKPKDSNPAWLNTHSDLAFVLEYLDRAVAAERERCAKVVEAKTGRKRAARAMTNAEPIKACEIAAAIRAG